MFGKQVEYLNEFSMKQKGLFFFSLMMLMSLPSFSQTLKDADRLYRSGEYDEARLIYVQLRNQSKYAADQYEKCIRLESLFHIAQDSCYNLKKYQSAKQYCDLILEVNPDCAKSKMLKQACDEALEELRRQRDEELEAARRQCSEPQLVAFREKYSKQKEQVEKANQISEDLVIWLEAKKAATKEGYDIYLTRSTYRYYVEEAEWEKGLIDCETVWGKIKNNRIAADVYSFKNQFEKYNLHMAEADDLLMLIEANKLYNDERLEEAWQGYCKVSAAGRVTLNSTEMANFLRCNYYHNYQQTANTEQALRAYVKNNPASPWCNEAIARANKIKKDNKKSHRKYLNNKYGSLFAYGVTAGYDLSLSSPSSLQIDHISSSGNTYAYDSPSASYSTFDVGARFRVGRSKETWNFVTGASLHLGEVARIAVPAEIHWNIVPDALFFGAGYEYQYVLDNKMYHDKQYNMLVFSSALYGEMFELGTRLKFSMGAENKYSSVGSYFTYYW